jgi:glycosyltransferase involved in cell wall biosynthesis
MKGNVGILTSYFYDFDGARIVYSGADRYGLELTRMLLDFGYDVRWWQIGSGWKKKLLPNVDIYSIPAAGVNLQMCPQLNFHFHEQAMEMDYAIYFVTWLAYPQAMEKSISISHGVFWDYPLYNSDLPDPGAREEWLRRMHVALCGPQKIVSVDTNTINWVNATWQGLGQKMEYIPNFVDIDDFQPRRLDPDRVRIIFPRRLTELRGLNESVQAAKVLTKKYPNVEFHFVGRGGSDSMEASALKWASGNDRIFYYWQPPHAIPEILRYMDIALIPTKAAEGTSLSCLEAMAAGCAVITTPVGGLSDLVIDGYNGLLIKPLPKDLIGAIDYLINNPSERERLGANASQVASAFSMKRWREKWSAVLSEVFR